MEKVEMNGILIGEVETKNIMTKSSLPATIHRRNSSATPENCWNSFEAVAQIF